MSLPDSTVQSLLECIDAMERPTTTDSHRRFAAGIARAALESLASSPSQPATMPIIRIYPKERSDVLRLQGIAANGSEWIASDPSYEIIALPGQGLLLYIAKDGVIELSRAAALALGEGER